MSIKAGSGKKQNESCDFKILQNPWLSPFFNFLTWCSLITKDSIKADMIAGITGAVIVLPQGVAFALIAGLPPEYGLYTAMVTPIIAALFGSSLHLISGPTTAISIVVFSTLSTFGQTPGSPEFISLALTMTFLAGLYQLAFGLARLGVLVNFVSHTVVVGFTAGAALLIITSQMKNVLGISLPRGESFLHNWVEIFGKLPEANIYVFIVALFTFLVAFAIKKYNKMWPNLLIALIAGSLFAMFFSGEGFGIKLLDPIEGHLPPLSMPDFSLGTIKMLAPGAFAVALLGLIEAVSISRAIATKSFQRIDGNQEFIGQGLSNIVGSFFSSYAGSGSFTRSGINYESGAQTPMSAIFAAFFLMIILLLVAPLMAYLPVAAMGGIILLVGYSLIDFKEIRHVLESSKTETAILATTFLATLFLELEFAIYLGVLLSLIIFLARTSTPDIISLAPDIDRRYNKKTLVDVETKPLDECPELKILRVDMSIYFGSLNHIQKKLFAVSDNEQINHILVIGSGINLIDLSGAEMLAQEAQRLKKNGGGLYFVGLKPTVYTSLCRGHIIGMIGNDHFFDDINEAITHVQHKIELGNACKLCEVKVFKECRRHDKKPALEKV